MGGAQPPKSFDELRARALEYGKKRGRARLGVAAASDECTLEAAHDAWKLELVDPVLVGTPDLIQTAAKSAGLDISSWRIVRADGPFESAWRAVELVRQGEVDLLMKGKMNTAVLMRAVLDKETGIRDGGLMSHIAIVWTPTFGRLLCMSDGGIVLAPSLEEKADIIRNAVDAMHKLGWECPNVAVVGALELVNPKMPHTIDAAALAKMNDRGRITGCIVDGPFGVDNALREDAARTKGLRSPVAGKAGPVTVADKDVRKG
ncbi:phosphate butyryltransferase, partial [bacterium]|nr:phosphate butyryltransferase [bacterium]